LVDGEPDGDMVDGDGDGDGDGSAEKVSLCHIPPGNPGNARVISISPDDVEAHLAHGDTLETDPCPPVDGDGDGDGGGT
jgi:hypothetical protein